MKKSVWIEGARAIAEGTAKIELEHLIVSDIGGEAQYQLLVKTPEDSRWELWWTKYETRLKRSVHLDDSHEANEAVRRYSRLTLAKGSNLEGVHKFLTEYVSVRTDMLKFDLLSNQAGATLMREIEEFKTKIEGEYYIDSIVFFCSACGALLGIPDQIQ